MSPFELLNTAAVFATAVLIGATAVVAMVQLGNSHRANQILIFNELRVVKESPEFAKAQYFVFRDLAPLLERSAFRGVVFAGPAARVVVRLWSTARGDLGAIRSSPGAVIRSQTTRHEDQ